VVHVLQGEIRLVRVSVLGAVLLAKHVLSDCVLCGAQYSFSCRGLGLETYQTV
jgi:hypothetical protein